MFKFATPETFLIISTAENDCAAQWSVEITIQLLKYWVHLYFLQVTILSSLILVLNMAKRNTFSRISCLSLLLFWGMKVTLCKENAKSDTSKLNEKSRMGKDWAVNDYSGWINLGLRCWSDHKVHGNQPKTHESMRLSFTQSFW